MKTIWYIKIFEIAANGDKTYWATQSLYTTWEGAQNAGMDFMKLGFAVALSQNKD